MNGGNADKGWRAYYDATAGRPPRPTLLWALERFDTEACGRRAADLGCGDGRDTVELLRRGWSIIAIDAEPAALERLQGRLDLPPAARLVTCCGGFQDVTWPEVDLVNSSFALPLCPAPLFPALWQKITASLASGGRFTGQLYGERDSWAGDPAMTFFREPEARQLLEGYITELFDEEESDAVTPRGEAKRSIGTSSTSLRVNAERNSTPVVVMAAADHDAADHRRPVIIRVVAVIGTAIIIAARIVIGCRISDAAAQQ